MFSALATHSPVILACLIACIAVLTRWQSLRRAALPALAGFGLALVVSLVSPVLWTILPQFLRETSTVSKGSVFTLVRTIQSLVFAFSLALILLAVLIDRAAPGAPASGSGFRDPVE